MLGVLSESCVCSPLLNLLRASRSMLPPQTVWNWWKWLYFAGMLHLCECLQVYKYVTWSHYNDETPNIAEITVHSAEAEYLELCRWCHENIAPVFALLWALISSPTKQERMSCFLVAKCSTMFTSSALCLVLGWQLGWAKPLTHIHMKRERTKTIKQRAVTLAPRCKRAP